MSMNAPKGYPTVVTFVIIILDHSTVHAFKDTTYQLMITEHV